MQVKPGSEKDDNQEAAFAPLAGIRVLDFSKVLAGPLCTQYLADLGADVIKVEPCHHGDDTRSWPPFRGGEGTIFLAVNRNKRSLAVDLKSPEGLAIARRLAADSDIVVESFGPGVADRLGIGHAALRALNPALIYCSISGYGTQGPMREGKGYDLVAQAFTGMLSITGERGGPPVRSPYSPVDQGSGLNAVAGILAALLQRGRTGQGAKLECSLFDTAVGMLGYILQGYWQTGAEPQPAGSAHDSLCPYQSFDTADRPLILGVANDTFWRSFCAVAGRPELADDAHFATGAARVANRDLTVAAVAELMRGATRAQWLERLEAAGIPCSPVHTIGELSFHPQTAASGMLLTAAHTNDPDDPGFRSVASPILVDGHRLAMRFPPPALGADSAFVLKAAGFDAAAIADLSERGVIRCASRSTAEALTDIS